MQQSEALKIPILFYLKRFYSLTGVFPLFAFLVLQYFIASLLLFADRDTVHQVILFQSKLLVTFLELLLLTLPLLFHFIYGLVLIFKSQITINFKQKNKRYWRYLTAKVAGIIFVVYLFFHLYQLMSVFFGSLTGLQFFQEVLIAHTNPVWMMLYWSGLLIATYYFCHFLWGFTIDWGFATRKRTQDLVFFLTQAVFVIMALYTAFMVIYQLYPGILNDRI